MNLKLRGKVALVTGSTRGIGLATAKAFAAEGCRIMLSARSTEQLRETKTALRATGAEAAAHAADVASPDGAARLIEAAVVAYGGIDILVNNVGGGGGGARIADSTDNDWRSALEQNLIQTVRMMRLALPHMKGRRGAVVLNVASISGWAPQLAMSGQYGAAKAALIFDTERWALEFVPHRIRVNTISPGSILVEGNGLGPLPPCQPGILRGLRAPRLSNGPPRHRRGGGGCDRVPRVATRPLDQRPQHSGGRSRAAARAARPPTVLGSAPMEFGTITGDDDAARCALRCADRDRARFARAGPVLAISTLRLRFRFSSPFSYARPKADQ